MPFKLLSFFIFYALFFNLIQTSAQHSIPPVADSSFVNLKEYSDEFVFDMKYATADNFLKTKVYDCAECFLRLKTVKALVQASESFKKLGYTIKIFDCYRPLSVQKKMFTIFPNPTYVADPAKGSIHNRGGAVDIALVYLDGTKIDFGTGFDFFGKESAHSYKKLSKEVLKNRKVLRTIMEENGFKALDSEWWHYNFTGALTDSVSNFNWVCD